MEIKKWIKFVLQETSFRLCFCVDAVWRNDLRREAQLVVTYDNTGICKISLKIF